jgi:hypothetical protein
MIGGTVTVLRTTSAASDKDVDEASSTAIKDGAPKTEEARTTVEALGPAVGEETPVVLPNRDAR